MHTSRDITLIHKFTKVIDNPQEAFNFGEEAAQYTFSFGQGYGNYEIESEDEIG